MNYFSSNILPRNNVNIVISKASVNDAQQIIDFLNEIGGETNFLTFGLNAFPISIEQERQIIAECLEKDNSLMLLGKIGNIIVSQLFLEVAPQPRLSHIGHIGLSVSKKHWGQSIGLQMMSTAIDWARNKKMTKLQLQVRVDNVNAIRLYHKLGFLIEGTISRSIKIDNVHFDEFFMGLQL